MEDGSNMPPRRGRSQPIAATSLPRSFRRTAKIVCSSLGALLLIAGCGSGESTIETRLQSDGYTPEKLVREIQIQYTALESPNARRSKGPSSSMTFEEKGRSGPGSSPEREELTFESATEDIKAKIAALQAEAGDEVDVLAEVIAGIEETDMSASLKTKIITALRS